MSGTAQRDAYSENSKFIFRSCMIIILCWSVDHHVIYSSVIHFNELTIYFLCCDFMTDIFSFIRLVHCYGQQNTGS